MPNHFQFGRFIMMFRSIKFSGFPIFLALLLNLILFAGSAWSDPKGYQPYNNNPLVAIVEGEPILLEDLKNAQIHDAMINLHTMQERLLKEKLLSRLAKKHPELGKATVPEVTQSDIEDFYKKTPGVKDLGTLEKMNDEIRDYLERYFRDSYVDSRYKLALKKGWVKVFLRPPSDFKLVAAVGTAQLWFEDEQKNSRKVFLLEFSDFQCPFCRRVQPTLNKLRERYQKEVQFGYRHFPLPFHKDAKFLAEAVECARDQGKFWELQTIFYKDSSRVTRENIINYARRAGVKDPKKFQECFKNSKYSKRVHDDLRVGMQLGIQGTPAFILGIYDSESDNVSGEMMTGAVSEDNFIRGIEKYLSILRTEANLVR